MAVVAVVIQFISAFEAELGPVTVVELGLGSEAGSELGTEVEVEPVTGTIWRLSGLTVVVVAIAVVVVVATEPERRLASNSVGRLASSWCFLTGLRISLAGV